MEIIAGVDEAGRGPLAGPVVAAAVILDPESPIPGLRDSKKLSARQRDKFYDLIQEQALAIGVGQSDEKQIDRINILNSTYKAMQMALGRLGQKPDLALIDGHALPNQIIPNRGIVKGDDKIDCIRAASIIAKVTRDRIMTDYDVIFPEYGFKQHKGYGTAQHIAALKEWKPSPIHRKSFQPVRNELRPVSWYSQAKKVGWLGEKLAALYLRDKGYRIIRMNEYISPYGEIDIIAEHSGDVVFIEVKTGRYGSGMDPEVNLTQQKLTKMENTINHYLQNMDTVRPIRVEAITVLLKGKTHIFRHIQHVDFDD
ncbi:MAG: ribonuclease HII [Fidelibacterota bacterium]